jgi:predicted ATPase
MKDLSNALSDSPILFLFLTRPITDDDAKPRATEAELLAAANQRVVLAELQNEDCVELVHALAPGLEALPEAVRTIVRRGQGNPFFVQAIVSTLIEQGILVLGGAGTEASLRGAIDDVSVPETVWGVLAERIDRLPADQKQALQMAAIIGRVFWEGLLADLAGMPIDAELRSLDERAFIESLGPAAFDDDWEWSFRHMLVHEVAYTGMLRSVRKTAHLRVGTWLEQRSEERRGELAPLLAYHFERGEDWEKAAEFAAEAGDRATELYANREASAAYRQALDAVALMPPDPATQRRLIELTLKLATVALDSVFEMLSPLERAKSLAEQLGDETLIQRVAGATTTLLWSNYSRLGFS